MILDTQTLETITAEVMEQYEQVRQSGVTNMFDRMGVAVAAEAREFYELLAVALDRDEYKTLLMNFGALMKHYGITQEVR